MERHEITFKQVTKRGKQSTKSTTYNGTAAKAKAEFKEDAALVLKHRSFRQTFVSIKKVSNAKTYDQYEHFSNRYGLKPDQCEFD